MSFKQALGSQGFILIPERPDLNAVKAARGRLHFPHPHWVCDYTPRPIQKGFGRVALAERTQLHEQGLAGRARVRQALCIHRCSRFRERLAGKPFPESGAPVDAKRLTDPGAASEALFVQLGSFSQRNPAEALLDRARRVVANPMRVREVETASGRFHRVQVGPFRDEDEALRAQSLLETHGFGQSILLTDTH